MPSMHLLLSALREEYPEFTFATDKNARWEPKSNTIFYSNDPKELLHELSHALLKHKEYSRDIELLKIESEAWEYAQKKLAPTYGVEIDDDTIQDALDTYRDWLHSRSTCPECRATGVQISPRTYSCLVCQTKWRVNEAKNCELRRYKIKPAN